MRGVKVAGKPHIRGKVGRGRSNAAAGRSSGS